MSYVSSMRSTLEMLRRSSNVRSSDIALCRAEVSSYLAKRILIYPPSLRQLGLRPDMTYQDRKTVLGLHASPPPPSDEELEFQQFLDTSARKQRRAAWIWRIGSEAEDMRDRGWYPFFVTLTVDPARVPDSEAMWRDGREFGKYLRRLAKVSARACGMASAIRNGASDRDFVRHVGVIEHGKTNQHHHMHLLVWMRGIPAKWKICPNRGIADPSSRTINFCREMGTFWPHSLPGLGKALYFRHEGDPWSRLGFCVPVDRKTGKPFKVLPARLAGVYVAKYMDKENKAWLHRVKATRDLGKGRLRNLLWSMAAATVEALTWRPRTYQLSVLVTTIHSVPPGLLRSMAKQVHFCKMWDVCQSDLTTLLRPNSGIFTQMLESVRDGAQPSRMSLKAFYDWVTGLLPVPVGYCDKRLSRAHCRLRVEFPPCREQPVSHLGGMKRE